MKNNPSVIYIKSNLTSQIERAFLSAARAGNLTASRELRDMNSIRRGVVLPLERVQELSLRLKQVAASLPH